MSFDSVADCFATYGRSTQESTGRYNRCSTLLPAISIQNLPPTATAIFAQVQLAPPFDSLQLRRTVCLRML